MFLKVQLPWNVIIPAENLDAKGLMLQRSIVVCLLDDFAKKRATKDLGYYLAVSTLESIGEGKVRQQTGDVLFPVVFSGITFKIFRGEILEGVVHKVTAMCPGENPVFLNDKTSKIGKDVAVRFIVLGTKWLEAEREFQALVSLEGDYLGPYCISLCHSTPFYATVVLEFLQLQRLLDYMISNLMFPSLGTETLYLGMRTWSMIFYTCEVLNLVFSFIGSVSLQSTSQIFSELTPVTTRVGKLLSGSLPAH
ncbi:DNA-DIRECTED RNA polymerase II III [Salix koriyanagi]|uniref:DNA-directed RNA polymerase subunit n=1 Tax=Salix koriyanagi TaxID=2511006 RepID=A0A9Q0WPV5_9ROSI|nr:DNA-DIRECTED RNA polymerase II III [Salix koriyanagi]